MTQARADILTFPNSGSESYVRQTFDRFIQDGFVPVEMPIMGNADMILDTIGERSRSELFFLENADKRFGALRYDFTLPLALHYLASTQSDARPECKIVSKGSVFRRRDNHDMRSSEFQQIGIEYIGHNERTKTDAECLAITLDQLSEVKKKHDLIVEISDIGLSRAICDMPLIPPIRAGRLKSALRHREKFMRILNYKKNDAPDGMLLALGELQNADAEKMMKDMIKLTGLKHSGLRSPSEIAERLMKKSQEQKEPDLDPRISLLLAAFYDLECPAERAAEKIKNLLSEINPDIDDYLQYYQRRLDIMKSFGVNTQELVYGFLVNRKPEYYSGFMFSVNVQTASDQSVPLAGGGRYDDLFKVLGTSDRIPAVGAELRPNDIIEFS